MSKFIQTADDKALMAHAMRTRWHCIQRRAQAGFSLIEIALVLIIVGLALGGIVSALGPQLANKRYSDTQARINEASEAIAAFAMANGRLPCPAIAAGTAAQRGVEQWVNQGTGECTSFDGFVPARTLGLAGQGTSAAGPLPLAGEGLIQDSWAFNIRYRVARVTNTANNFAGGTCGAGINTCFPLTQANGIRNAYYRPAVAGAAAVAASPGPPPTPAVPAVTAASAVVTPIPAAAQLQICNSSSVNTPLTCGTAATVAQAAFVVWSTGRNGNATEGPDEAANLDGDIVYVVHERIEASTPPIPRTSDDIFQWQTAAGLQAILVRAGVLP